MGGLYKPRLLIVLMLGSKFSFVACPWFLNSLSSILDSRTWSLDLGVRFIDFAFCCLSGQSSLKIWGS